MNIATLFSGGKDSVYSLYLVQKAGLDVKYLVTAYAQRDSYMYHVPAIHVSEIAAKALRIPQIRFTVTEEDEITPLRDALSGLEIDGLCSGAVASNYQRRRVVKVCDDLGIQSIMPLWHKDPMTLLVQMVNEGFEILIVSVAAMGLDERWLGQVLSKENSEEFLQICETNRIHPLGEGGEYETMVLSGPHMQGRIEVEFEKKWFGNTGELEITDARLNRDFPI
ncbi:MAG: diphthine--ammonia ligase [Methanotrichaceae archaeon]